MQDRLTSPSALNECYAILRAAARRAAEANNRADERTACPRPESFKQAALDREESGESHAKYTARV